MKSEGYPLTKRQQSLLRFLYRYRNSHGGEGPKLITIVQHEQLSSNRSAIDMLATLLERGYLERPSSDDARISKATILTDKAIRDLGLLKMFHAGGFATLQPDIQKPRQQQEASSYHIVGLSLNWNAAEQPSGTSSNITVERIEQ